MDDIVDIEDDEEIEEEASEEVDKVLFDLTDGKLGQAGSVSNLPVSPTTSISLSFHSFLLATQAMEIPIAEADVDKEMEGYRKRLDGLLS